MVKNIKTHGVTAYSKTDGVITKKIKSSGTVNTNVAGTYIITYTVTDSAGRTSTITRTVIVEEPLPPTPPIGNNTTP